MRFSIVVPVFNSQKYLKKCLNSIVNRSFRDYEAILVDDGSTDSSGAMCDDYVKRFDNVSVIHKQNQGQIAARLDGVKKATGVFIVFVDSDDTIELNALEVLNGKIEQYNPDGVAFECSRMTSHGLITRHSGKHFKDFLITDKAELYREILSSSSYCSVCKKTFKRSVFNTAGLENLFNLRIGEDFYQTMDLIANASSVLFISDDLYNYRNNPGSVIHREQMASRFKMDFSSAYFVIDLINNSPLFKDKEKEIEKQSRMNVQEIAWKLGDISNLKTNYQKKVELFDGIKKDPYFIDYISKLGTADLCGREKMVYELFLNSQYRTLIRRERIASIPGRIKHLISVIL